METVISRCSEEDVAAGDGAIGDAQAGDEGAAEGKYRVCWAVEVDDEYVFVDACPKGAGV